MALLLALLAAVNAELIEDQGVLKLDDINFMDALETYDRVLVNFSEPSCGHCKKLDLEYKKAAQKLKAQGSSVQLGIYEVVSDTHAATAYDIKAYPTLQFFVDKKPVSQTSASTAEEIVAWVNHKSLPALKVINSLSALQDHIKANTFTFVTFASIDSKERVLVEKAAKEVEGVSFALCTDLTASAHYNLKADKPKAFVKGTSVHEFTGEASVAEIARFIKKYRLAMVPEFSIDLAELIFEDQIPTLVVFNMGEVSSNFKADLESISNSFDLIISSADMSKSFNRRLAEYLGVQSIQRTFAMILQGEHKYLLAKSITVESLSGFVESWQKGTLSEYTKTQDEPSNEVEKGVRVLVSSTFDEVVDDPSKDVLVLYCVPWCPHCHDLLAIYQELAEFFADSRSVVIAKIDASSNDVKGVTAYPTIKLHTKDNKDGVVFEGSLKYDDLVEFVRSAGSKLKKDEL